MQIHRSDKYKAHEDSIAKVKSLPVEFKPFYEVKAVHGEAALEKVLARMLADGDARPVLRPI